MDIANNTLCLEKVSKDNVAQYDVLDLDNNTLIYENISVKEDLSFTLTDLKGDFLIFTHYSSNENPDRTGLLIYKISSGKITWEHSSTKLLDFGENYIKVPHPFFKDKNVYINLEGIEFSSENELIGTAPNNNVNYPLMYTDESEHFATFRTYLVEHLQHIPVRSCEYLEFNDHIFISYYIARGKMMDNFLVVAKSTGDVSLCLKIGANLSGIAKDSFFILDNRLIFVANKDTLNIYGF